MDMSLFKHPVVNQILAKKNHWSSMIFPARDEVCTLLIQFLPSLSRMRGYHLLDRSMHDYILGSSSLGTVCSPEPCSPIDLWRPLFSLSAFSGNFWTLKWRYSTTCLAIFWGDSLKVSITGAMYGRYLQFCWCVQVRVSSINPHFA